MSIHSISLVPRLSRRANKLKERGEPGRIYYVRNVIGREDLIVRGELKLNTLPAHSFCKLLPGKMAFFVVQCVRLANCS